MSRDLSVLRNYSGQKHYHHEPWPHVVIHDALPKALYKELSDGFPLPLTICRGAEYHQNTRYDFDARYLLGDIDTSVAWHKFVAYHCGAEFWSELIDIFQGPVIEKYGLTPFFQDLPSIEGDFHSLQVGIRNGIDYKRWDVHMDCKPGFNTPVEVEGSVRGDHVDNPHTLIFGLLYMRTPEDDSTGGALTISRWKSGVAPTFHAKAEVYSDLVEEVKRIPYRANTLVLGLNSPISIHGVTPRCVTPHYRRLINFVAEVPSRLFITPKSKRKTP